MDSLEKSSHNLENKLDFHTAEDINDGIKPLNENESATIPKAEM